MIAYPQRPSVKSEQTTYPGLSMPVQDWHLQSPSHVAELQLLATIRCQWVCLTRISSASQQTAAQSFCFGYSVGKGKSPVDWLLQKRGLSHTGAGVMAGKPLKQCMPQRSSSCWNRIVGCLVAEELRSTVTSRKWPQATPASTDIHASREQPGSEFCCSRMQDTDLIS